ncbi:MAG: bifunctional folylpolyglutamate synthase/dihydrofolate synthase [Elusimicrobiota bacterium]|jgi:dihydrofolate synthase/folylpolyglutamate synthase|nr:bifunctional folylpolyglutamate synthase/dihydrofolate synthase [Elusimicrobiota bacterium]
MKYLNELKEYIDMKPGLSRIKKFLQSAGNPQNGADFIHIAGTNGKGSAAYYIAEILKQNGYKTGLYTSPHLIDISERIKINGKPIPSRKLNSIIKNNISFAKKCKLSFFEFLTAAAFIYFKSQKIDLAVLETGLGGRFDAVNIIENPILCLITSISFDHTEILGSSLKKIAAEKAGIIKKNADVILGGLPKEALKEIEKIKASKVFSRDFSAQNFKLCRGFQKFDFYCGGALKLKNVKIKMLGKHQIKNASLALSACETLKKRGFILKERLIRKALLNVKVPARFDEVKLFFEGEKIKEMRGAQAKVLRNAKTKLIIDGAHNEESIFAFIELWRSLKYDSNKKPFIFAAMKEKNYKKIIEMLAPLISKVILPDIKNLRAADFKTLKNEFLKYLNAENVVEAHSSREALKFLKGCPIAAAVGSLYLAGDIYKILKNQKAAK